MLAELLLVHFGFILKSQCFGGGGNQYLYFITLSEMTRNGLVTTWIRDTQFCARIN